MMIKRMGRMMLWALVLCSNMAVRAEPVVTIGAVHIEDPVIEVAVKVLEEAYGRAGLELRLQYYPAERAIQLANAGRIDGDLQRIPGVEQQYPNLVPVPVVLTQAEFMVFSRQVPVAINSWESLKPYKLAHIRGIKAIEEKLPPGVQAEAVDSPSNEFKMLKAGRVDLVIQERILGLGTAREQGIDDLVVMEPPLLTQPFYHYLHKKKRALVEPLTQALHAMEKEGVTRRIREQVFREWAEKGAGSPRLDEPELQP